MICRSLRGSCINALDYNMDWYPRENYLKKIRDFYHVTDIVKVITYP